MSLNQVTLSGNLGKDSELRMTATGTAVLTFSIAANERRRQQDGTYQDKTSWFDCVMFGARAQGIEPYLRRGTKLSLTGHLNQNKYEKDGRTYSRVEIIVDEVELMNARRETQQPEGTPAPAPVQAASVYDDEIPF